MLRAMRLLPKTLRSIGNVLNKWQAYVWCMFRLSYGRWKRYVLPMLRGAEHEKISIRSSTFHTNNTNSNLRPEQGDKSHEFKFSPVPPSVNICPWHNPLWQTVFIIVVSQHTVWKVAEQNTWHYTLWMTYNPFHACSRRKTGCERTLVVSRTGWWTYQP